MLLCNLCVGDYFNILRNFIVNTRVKPARDCCLTHSVSHNHSLQLSAFHLLLLSLRYTELVKDTLCPRVTAYITKVVDYRYWSPDPFAARWLSLYVGWSESSGYRLCALYQLSEGL